ncbi:hypothetical protein [Kitasatospora sp. McL0602]|uniref:hypothetical protein n=1 Tax=Kitasatospora sp. McL0602 TaxID=3439530 RepID=UPI003F88C2A3
MDTRQDDLRRDLDAAVQTRKELGSEYESAIIDSFLARLEARAAQPPAAPAAAPAAKAGSHFKIQVLSLVMGIPLTGIAAGVAGLSGLVVCWAGIVGVNVSAAIADRRIDRRTAARSEWA